MSTDLKRSRSSNTMHNLQTSQEPLQHGQNMTSISFFPPSSTQFSSFPLKNKSFYMKNKETYGEGDLRHEYQKKSKTPLYKKQPSSPSRQSDSNRKTS
mmetsp:Transcript_12103/g.11963  ORF Transcript_12103/g.11963 Transcript_12103/m.11963 type:complete len:98 (+) Transcript_12103:68-361(+)